MSFKIVRTIERGKPQLCIVPAQWENNGILKWPKKSAEKLAKNNNSIPTHDWTSINCMVKRRNLVSYEAAELELQTMLEYTDTEQEDDRVTLRRPVERQQQVNLNSFAEELICSEKNDSRAEVFESGSSEAQTSQTYIIVSESENIGNPVQPLPEPNTDIQNILQNQSVLFELMGSVIENQKKIMHEIASLSIQIEESNRNSKTKVVNLSKAASDPDNNPFILKQIKSVKDLEDMELLLSDNEQRIKLIQSCSIICSGGKGKGTTCAYRFLDVLFSREFLCECSWSGSTRGDGIKISLKCYKNTLNFFFTMINQWDMNFTQEDNDTFFKNVMKNANKRKGVKFDRIPTKRQRSKKKSRNDEQMSAEKNTKEIEEEGKEETKEKYEKKDTQKNESEEEESLLC